MEEMAVVPTDATVAECSDLSNAILSMPNLDEFMPVVVNGQVQPVDAENLCEVELMEEGVVPSSPVVNSFNDLLKVDDPHCLLLDDLSKPMLDLITPITSPNVLNSGAEEIVSRDKDLTVVSAPNLSCETNKSDKVLKHTEHVKLHSEC